LIGESPSNQSYLLGDKIIEVAKSLGWMLFILVWILSENADFAEKAEQNNIILLSQSHTHNGSKLRQRSG
jgi:propionyl-CoA carboxylase alpha chain